MQAHRVIFFAILLLGSQGGALKAAPPLEPPAQSPEATINLATAEGVGLVKGQWRYSDVKIVEVEFKSSGPEGQPTGNTVKTYSYTPQAGEPDFDDTHWEVLSPATLNKRRTGGRISFNWYRIRIVIPDHIDGFDPTGATVVFETSIDDYAEIWVDGELPRALGQSGGSVIKGWNASNRLIIGRDLKPGLEIQLAIFGINGPISDPPTNYIWMRYAKLEFFKLGTGPITVTPQEVNVRVLKVDPALDAIVPPNPKILKLAEGFDFTEGPVWIRDQNSLLFSDPNKNRIYRYSPEGSLSVFRENSGYAGTDVIRYKQPGSNGLTLDPKGRLTICEHGNRRVTRLEGDGTLTVLADQYEGKRLNSPNDLVYRSDGALFFTDPPFGLPQFFDDPAKEIPYSGVYSFQRGKLKLVSKELKGPNGLAFSPDEKYLYVGNWDEKRKVVMRYKVNEDGVLSKGVVFYDMTSAPGKDAIDGIKVDQQGNLYISGPGGLWIISPAGKHLGTIFAPKPINNMAWGDNDGKTLYLCARNVLYRIRMNLAGIRP